MGFTALFGNSNADTAEKIRKQKYLREAIYETSGTDTENAEIELPISAMVDHHRTTTKSSIISLDHDSIYSLALPTINTPDNFFSLSQLVGSIAIVINVACAWGKTALTYEQIQLLLRAANNEGLDDATDLEADNIVILAFPTNDFRQEPGSNEDIAAKILDLLGPELYHSPNFILFPKSSLETNPVYKLLNRHMPQTHVRHNFYKYIVGRDGLPVKFYTKKDDLLEVVTQFKETVPLMDESRDKGKDVLTN